MIKIPLSTKEMEKILALDMLSQELEEHWWKCPWSSWESKAEDQERKELIKIIPTSLHIRHCKLRKYSRARKGRKWVMPGGWVVCICIAKWGGNTPSKPHTSGSAPELSWEANNSIVWPDFLTFKENLEIHIFKCLENFFQKALIPDRAHGKTV